MELLAYQKDMVDDSFAPNLLKHFPLSCLSSINVQHAMLLAPVMCRFAVSLCFIFEFWTVGLTTKAVYRHPIRLWEIELIIITMKVTIFCLLSDNDNVKKVCLNTVKVLLSCKSTG